MGYSALLDSSLPDVEEPTPEYVRTALHAALATMRQDVVERNQARALSA